MRMTKDERALFALGLLGLVLAVLSGMSEHLPLLASWCDWFSGGCRATSTFTLFSVRVWVWGAAYYLLLCLGVLSGKGWLDWLIPVGVGVEAALVGIMVFIGAPCVFCMANAVVVALLALVFLRREILWQALALGLAGFMVGGALLAGENHLLPLYCSRISRPPVAAGFPPTPQYVTITQDDSQVTGPADAPVTVFVYSDFRCPACRRMNKVVSQAMKDYDGKVRWVFKNFPLPMHPDAEIASEGALCAAAQNKFWEFHDILFNTEETFTPESLTRIAQGLGLDQASFRRCLDTHAAKPQVDREVEQGVKAGINAVPCFIINGKVETGSMPADVFRAALDAALAAKGAGK